MKHFRAQPLSKNKGIKNDQPLLTHGLEFILGSKQWKSYFNDDMCSTNDYYFHDSKVTSQCYVACLYIWGSFHWGDELVEWYSAVAEQCRTMRCEFASYTWNMYLCSDCFTSAGESAILRKKEMDSDFQWYTAYKHTCISARYSRHVERTTEPEKMSDSVVTPAAL